MADSIIDPVTVPRRVLKQARDALRRVQWGAMEKCVVCGRPRAYQHHVCSCPIKISLRDLDRALEERA